jgi:hypothetical protein
VNPWHTLTDSDAYRRITKRGPVRRVLRSPAFRRLDVARNDLRSARAARRDPSRFDRVQNLCFFVGHNKSGATMLGALLDAHRDVLISDELDVLQYVEAGLRRDQIFQIVLRGSRAEARKGRITARRIGAYSYLVPGQWQGVSEKPLAIGDSTTGTSTRRLGDRIELLERAADLAAPAQLKLIHVIRNPFDPISVMMVRGRRSFEETIDRYFAACETLVRIRAHVDPGSFVSVRHETFVADPVRGLDILCRSLSVEPGPDYLRACAGIIRPTPDRSREMVEWTPAWIDRVEQRIDEVDFLSGYSYAG